MDSEVSYMLENNRAVPSSSSWASPGLIMEKSDNVATIFAKSML